MSTTNNYQIRQFITITFLFGDDSKLQNDTSLTANGIIDSTGILELISFLEQTYQIKIHDEELIPENLDTLNNISRFLERKLSCAE